MPIDLIITGYVLASLSVIFLLMRRAANAEIGAQKDRDFAAYLIRHNEALAEQNDELRREIDHDPADDWKGLT